MATRLLAVFGVLVLHSLCPVLAVMIDLSYQYEQGRVPYWPGHSGYNFTIKMRGYSEQFKAWFEHNEYSTSEHIGTHMDAPCHLYDRRLDNKPDERMWRLHQIPLSHFIAHAVVIDISDRADPRSKETANAQVMVDDILKWEQKHGRIPDGSVVFMHSGWDKYAYDRETYYGSNTLSDIFSYNSPGFHEDVAQWLGQNRKVYGIGSDAMSLDYGKTHVFRTHAVLFKYNMYGLENVKNVGLLPPKGATVYIFPTNIEDGSGGPTRVIAVWDDATRDVFRSAAGVTHLLPGVKLITTLAVLLNIIF